MRACHHCGKGCEEGHRFCPNCGRAVLALRSSSGDPMIGRTIGADYTILEAVGAGGMGRVYRAEKGVLGKTLAVKVIHPHLAGDENAAKRFLQEAHTSSKLNHPNAVVVLDFGRTDDELLYLVMEYLRGRDLTRIVWEAGRLPLERATSIVRQVLAALKEAHDHGIVHRDIKPENILVEALATGGDFVKVVDFGLAKMRSDQSPGVTSPGFVCGTPDYMAPEQGRGGPPDPRSDLYSAAVVLFYCVTGRLPFESDEAAKVLEMHGHSPAPDPRIYVPELPQRFVDALQRGLAKNVADRFQDAVEFAEALRSSLHSERPEALESETAPCPSCGHPVPEDARFCGRCGFRKAPPSPALVSPTQADTPLASDLSSLPLCGRDVELSQLELGRARAAEGALVPLAVVGDEGSGRARLVSTVCDHARRAGCRVVYGRPDPRLAGVTYHAIGGAVRALLGLADGEDVIAWVDRLHAASPDLDPSLRAGFVELFTDKGPLELDADARAEAALRAVIFAAREALQGSARPVIVVIENAHRADGASLRIVQRLMARPVALPMLLVLTCAAPLLATLPRCEAIHLRGLEPREGARLADSARALLDTDGFALPSWELPPLHIEQLLRWHGEGGGPAPERLVDLIAARVERLSTRARRVLPAVAVLGVCDAAEAARVAGVDVDDSLLRALRATGWLAPAPERPGAWRVAHLLIRDVLAGAIPAAVRVELHQAALETGGALPVEVAALHAELTHAFLLALLKLEEVGDRAMARGDYAVAAHALRRGMELARREYLKGESDYAERAMSLFARKLGEAMVSAGDFAEAEGVLREGLGVAPTETVEWVRLQAVLARAYFLRGRHGASESAVDAAAATAARLGQVGLAVEVLMARAELEVSAGADRRAAETLARADALLEGALARAPAGDALWRQRAEVLLWLARSRRVIGEAGSEQLLERARSLAEQADLQVLRAQCDAEAAEHAEASADRRRAQLLWRRAAHDAREAGDIALAGEYDKRLRRLGIP